MEFEEIYRACFKPVYQYVRRLSGNEHIAEEVTSDTFFKALKSIDRFRGECDMRVWLCQIARNTYYSYLKKNSRLASVDGAELSNIADPGAGVEEKVRAREEARQIREGNRRNLRQDGQLGLRYLPPGQEDDTAQIGGDRQ